MRSVVAFALPIILIAVLTAALGIMLAGPGSPPAVHVAAGEQSASMLLADHC